MSTPEIYRELESGAWNEINPSKCLCRNGWLLSDFDTWHRCKTHGVGVPHPEDESDESDAFDRKEHHLKVMRAAYTTFRDMANRNGFKGDFKAACLKVMVGDDRSPKAWVNAAEEIADMLSQGAAENRAKAFGYRSAFEMRMHEDAMIERAEWERGW